MQKTVATPGRGTSVYQNWPSRRMSLVRLPLHWGKRDSHAKAWYRIKKRESKHRDDRLGAHIARLSAVS